MLVKDKVIVVTGGAGGIGRALCRRFTADGARAVIVADIVGAPNPVDVTREDQVSALVADVEREHGRIDLFCSNAGVAVDGDERTTDADWERCWNVNLMAHVFAARAVLPGMLARGGGYLLQTVSAAGLLTHPFSATYAVTKHASLAFAEWLSIAYGDRGITVSAICPQGVRTDMLLRDIDRANFLLAGALEPEQVADAVVQGLADERFLILPHPEVAEYFKRKAGDYDRWLRGMRRLRRETGSAAI